MVRFVEIRNRSRTVRPGRLAPVGSAAGGISHEACRRHYLVGPGHKVIGLPQNSSCTRTNVLETAWVNNTVSFEYEYLRTSKHVRQIYKMCSYSTYIVGCPLIFEILNFCLFTPSNGSIGHKNNACKIFLKKKIIFRGCATRSKLPKNDVFHLHLHYGGRKKSVSQKYFFFNIFPCFGWPWIR